MAIMRAAIRRARVLGLSRGELMSMESVQGYPRRGMGMMHQPLGQVPEGTDLNEVRSKWGSNAMDMIQELPPSVVEGNIAICDGGGGPLGHPVEYIKLEGTHAAVCKYCGQRFVQKGH